MILFLSSAYVCSHKRTLSLLIWCSLLCGTGVPLQASVLSPAEIQQKLLGTTDPGRQVSLYGDLVDYYSWRAFDSAALYVSRIKQIANQTQSDSILAEAYRVEGELYVRNHRGGELFSRFFSLSKGSLSSELMAAVWLNLHRSYVLKKETFYALSALQLSMNLVDSSMNHRIDASIFIAAGDYAFRQGQYQAAYSWYQKALARLETEPESTLSSELNIKLGKILLETQNPQQANAHARAALREAQQTGSVVGIINSFLLLGETQYREGDLNAAFHSANTSQQLCLEHGIAYFLGPVYALLSKVCWEQGNAEAGIRYAKEGLKQQDEEARIACELVLCKRLLAQGEYEALITRIQKILSTNPTVQSQIKSLELLSTAYGKQGDFEQEALLTNHLNALRKRNEEQGMMLLITEQATEQVVVSPTSSSELYQWRYATLLLYTGGFILITLLCFLYNRYAASMYQEQLTKVRKALITRDKVLEKFAYFASHDLLEHVRVINSMTTLICKDIERGEFSENFKRLEYVRSGARVLEIMGAGIREYTDHFNQKVALSRFAVDSIISDIDDWFENHPNTHNAKIHWELEKSKITFVYPALVKLFQKLLTNAIQAQQGNALMCSIKGTKMLGMYLLEISDEGIGVNPRYHDIIFEPFQALENKMNSQSAGLGLAICKLIVEGHGGKIWMNSQLGVGTSVFVTIPYSR